MPIALTQLQLKLKNELENSILVDQEDRDFWLAQLPELNETTVQHLLETLSPANQLVNSYVDTALAQDQNQEHLIALKAKFDQIKRNALKLEEKSSSKTDLSQTEDLLKKLDKIN
jgi:hypothetical protein